MWWFWDLIGTAPEHLTRYSRHVHLEQEHKILKIHWIIFPAFL